MERRRVKLPAKIENVTAKIPSDVYLWGAVAIMGISLSLQIMGMRHRSLFLGQWAPSILIIGLYNKLVKVGGHDTAEPDMKGNSR